MQWSSETVERKGEYNLLGKVYNSNMYLINLRVLKSGACGKTYDGGPP